QRTRLGRLGRAAGDPHHCQALGRIAHAGKILPPGGAGKPLATSPPLDIVVHLDLTPTEPPRLPGLPERPRARGGEPRPPRRRPVLRLERVLDAAALLGRERDRGRV